TSVAYGGLTHRSDHVRPVRYHSGIPRHLYLNVAFSVVYTAGPKPAGPALLGGPRGHWGCPAAVMATSTARVRRIPSRSTSPRTASALWWCSASTRTRSRAHIWAWR